MLMLLHACTHISGKYMYDFHGPVFSHDGYIAKAVKIDEIDHVAKFQHKMTLYRNFFQN